MRSQFVSSLRDPVRRYVLSKNPVRFEAAVEAAVHEEHNKSLTAREERMHIVAAEVQPENREIAQLTETLDRLEHLLSQQTKHECRATSAQQLYGGNQTQGRWYHPEGQEIQCFACWGYGHLVQYCPTAEEGINRGQRAWQAEIKPKEVIANSRHPNTWVQKTCRASLAARGSEGERREWSHSGSCDFRRNMPDGKM